MGSKMYGFKNVWAQKCVEDSGGGSRSNEIEGKHEHGHSKLTGGSLSLIRTCMPVGMGMFLGVNMFPGVDMLIRMGISLEMDCW